MKKLILFALAAICILPLNAKHKRQVAIVAHRGYWACEAGGNSHNSIASLKAAQDLGVWGSEFDVNMTKDGELMVFHDDAVNGMKFAEHNASEFAGITERKSLRSTSILHSSRKTRIVVSCSS